MSHESITATRTSNREIPLPHDWNRHLKRGLLAVIALAHAATVNLYRQGHQSAHPLFRHQVRLKRVQTHAELLETQLRVQNARSARASLGHYRGDERFTILQVQMARGWSHARTAREFQLCDRTIAKWHREFENEALVKGPGSPVNKFPDYVRLIVITLKRTFPHLGHRKIAELLARTGLVLAGTTVRRHIARPKQPQRPPTTSKNLLKKKPDSTQLVARYPGHIWHCDITCIPTDCGAFFSWWPTCFPRVFPRTRSVVAVIDSFSREILAIRCFGAGVTAIHVIETLSSAVTHSGAPPRHLITDKGSQFFNCKTKNPSNALRGWLDKHRVNVRFGAVGKKGSVAIIERFFLTLKDEGIRRTLIPLGRSEVAVELSVFAKWYNTVRPHASLSGCTPEEARCGQPTPSQKPRFESRPNYPVAVEDLATGRVWRIRSATLNAKAFKRRRHLPDVSLNVAA